MSVLIKVKVKVKEGIEYIKWKISNPDGKFSDYYKDTILNQLTTDRPHPTLGSKRANPEKFERTGKRILDFLLEYELAPQDKVVDYGAGSLRVGKHLIEYLEKDKYIAMDITEAFYNEGLKMLKPSLIDEKKPKFFKINSSNVELVKNEKPDFIISQGVLLHIPKKETEDYLTKIVSIMGPNTVALISFKESEKYLKLAKFSWSYPFSFLETIIKNLNANVKTSEAPFGKFLVIKKNPNIAPS